MFMTSIEKISQAICVHSQGNGQMMNAMGLGSLEGFMEEVGPKLSRG